MSRRSFNTTAQGLCIRLADGVRTPLTPKILAQPGFQEYHGPDYPHDVDGNAQALAWARGRGGGNGKRVVLGAEEDVFDIRTATAAQLVEFAETDYGVTLDETADVEQLRAQVRHIVRQQKENETAATIARDEAARIAASKASGIAEDDKQDAAKPAARGRRAPPTQDAGVGITA